MRKIISFILGTIVALNLSVSVANAAANEVRVAFFLEWATPNQEAKVKKTFDKALSKVFLTFASWFGVAHSKKNATLTSFAAALATETDKLRATIVPRIKLIIFLI